ncbi:hypothetical protein PGT21_018147 [Puccinia graminis f. sp. tritici]|uniref:Uncharacterized protein n=1 Tax=Puccinia graminis f. sp. tritici TaxID=56615 RepID=A0A5B0QTM9_PUCGR|nr:hypothetical protein PGT21_018147 [Puccinia graminis f. sp. tritici]
MQTNATKLWCIASHCFADAILIHCIEESDASNAMRGPASLLRCDAIKARYDAIPMHASHQFHQPRRSSPAHLRTTLSTFLILQSTITNQNLEDPVLLTSEQ